ncbi:MAG: thioesterase family protein [Candidatus Omnitrophota bacterium]
MGYKARVYYHHTDSGGVVYYANYLQFLEEARTDFLERKGISVPGYVKQGRHFVVSRQEIDYRAPARYGDLLDIDTLVQGVSGVRIDLAHDIHNGSGSLIIQARTILAFIDTDFKPRAIPGELKARILAPLPQEF